MAYLPPEYHRHTPEDTVLYQVVAEYYPSFIRRVEADPNACGFPDFVKREFDEYLRCGIKTPAWGDDFDVWGKRAK